MGQGSRANPVPAVSQERIADAKPALHSMQVVKERALRERSGVGAAPALGAVEPQVKQKARFLAETGPQMSVEGGV